MVGAATGSSRLNCTPDLKLSNTFERLLWPLPPFTRSLKLLPGFILEARLSDAPLNALDRLLADGA